MSSMLCCFLGHVVPICSHLFIEISLNKLKKFDKVAFSFDKVGFVKK